jgi:ribosomal protein L7/L12
MTEFKNNPFEYFGDDSDSFEFDPTLPSYMKSRSGSEIPETDYCSFVSGARHPSLDAIRCLTQPPEIGALMLPSTIPLLNQDSHNPLSRTPIYGIDLVIQSNDRCKHVMVFGPTGGGKNVTVLNMFRFSALRDPKQTTVTFSLKASDYGPVEAICRATGKKLVVVNLNDAWRSVAWNPLNTKFADLAFDRIRRFADAVKNPNSHDSEFWTQWIKVALKGAWEAGYRSFPAIFQLFSLPKQELIDKLRSHGNTCSSQLVDFLTGESHNAQTVLASIIGAMSCFLSDNVMRVMSKDELNLRELLQQPVCLHVEMPETSLETQQVLYQMLARIITDELITVGEETPLTAPPATIFYDDMPSLGYLLSPNRLMTMRSRGIGVVAGVQSLASLELVYGPSSRALIDNFHTKIILPGGPSDDAAFFACASGEQMIGLPTFEGQNPTFINRSILSSSAIRSPAYKHPNFGMPATLMFGAITFQAYLQRSYEHPSVAHIVRSARRITGRERLRTRRPSRPKSSVKSRVKESNCTSGISDTNGWTESQLKSKLEQVRKSLDWDNTTGSARKWWSAFEDENTARVKLVLRLAEELAIRKATVTEFFLAYVYSNTDNIQANLHYLDYTRLKKEEEAKKRKTAGVSLDKKEVERRQDDETPEKGCESTADPNELTFVRCKSCRSLVPEKSNKCRMCGHAMAMLDMKATKGIEVILTSFVNSKMNVIKVVKNATGKSLMDAKKLVEAAPTTIGRARTHEDAAKVIQEIQDAGGQARIA